jgi:hypothetical protein
VEPSYDGLVFCAAEGSGDPDTLGVAGDAPAAGGVGLRLEAKAGDAVPMDGASEMCTREEREEREAREGGMYTPASGGRRGRLTSTTATATEMPVRARMEMRMTNQWRRQKEGVRDDLRCGGMRSEVDEGGLDRDWMW